MDEMDENPKLRVIGEDDYSLMVNKLLSISRDSKTPIDIRAAGRMVDNVLRLAGAIYPPPVPGTDTCTALLATPNGWHQCFDEPDHGADNHDDGDWSWDDTDPNSIPAVGGSR